VLNLGLRLRSGTAAVAVALGLGLAVPVVAAPPAFCADEGPRAVLVVDRENGAAPLRMCVGLPDEEVSGIKLIKLANAQYGLQYRLGHGGAAVCQLANVPAGTPPNDCLRQGDPFWGYWRGDGGGWQWSGSGAAATEVRDGDVDGWSFGMGNDGSSHPQPPSTRASDVCRPARNGGGSGPGERDGPGSNRKNGGSDSRFSGDEGSGDRRGPKGSGAPGVPAPDAGGSDDTPGSVPAPGTGEARSEKGMKPRKGPAEPRKDGPKERMKMPSSETDGGEAPAPIDVSSPTPGALPAGATSAEDDGGVSDFPALGLVALGAAVAMGTAAAVVTAKRRKRGAR
jgi:hypothetical protein